ncbi:MAG: phosphoglucomutase/phosphomannomutase family protein [Chloroflexota bacterium]|nr:phosphoglucomutase/phosphomannomutase family protein [Chloroflexota bacterium]
MAIKFGTDGWRAIIAEDFTFENVRLCTQGVVRYLQQQGLAEQGLVVGYDTRFASEDFALAVAETAAGSGVKTFLSDRAAPTPVVTYNVIDRRAGGAVIITASHNPPQWNGFKFKEYAGSASPEITDAIEALIEDASREGSADAIPWAQARSSGTGVDIDPSMAYAGHVGSLVDLARLRSAGLKLVVDPMFGAGAGYLPSILGGGSTTLQEMHAERNPLFPGLRQPEPVADNLTRLCERVTKTGADAGLALDGDADRFGLVDEKGRVINPLQVFALLALYMLETRGDRGPVVKSATTSRMLYRLGEIFEVPVHETPVGFKYVGPLMEREGALIGGEESGGYGFRGHIPERDGILSALFILDMMVRTGRRPSKLLDHLYDLVGPHFYDRSDIPLLPGQREVVAGAIGNTNPDSVAGVKVASSDTTDGRRFVLEDGSWVTVRLSGTEPLVRIYAEAPSQERVESLLAEARGLVGL